MTQNSNSPNRDVEPENSHRDSRPTDNISLSSFGPATTTIKVPYKQQMVRRHEVVLDQEKPAEIRKQRPAKQRQREPDQILYSQTKPVEPEIAPHKTRANLLHESANDPRSSSESEPVQEPHKPRFDYRTVIANVQASPIPPKQQVVGAYNVRVIRHNSPFSTELQPVTSVSDLSSSIARLELLSSELSTSKLVNVSETHRPSGVKENHENNESGLVSTSQDGVNTIPLKAERNDDDLISTISSSSLRSSRTYDIATSDLTRNDEDLDDESHFPVTKVDTDTLTSDLKFEDETRPSAWIFDIKDCTSTAIKPPPKPAKPELPKVDSKELAESRGGRSYYLELIESGKDSFKKQRPSSIDSLYSRSNSHSTLGGSNTTQLSNMQKKPLAKSSYQLTATKEPRASRPSRQTSNLASLRARSSSAMRQPVERTSPNPANQCERSTTSSTISKAKSSSCLASSTRPSKYSIYGGLRNPNERNKPVPRLSYSRAIGPKSQRQLDVQSKTPSRYLKMR